MEAAETLSCFYGMHYIRSVWRNYVQTLNKMQLYLPDCKKRM